MGRQKTDAECEIAFRVGARIRQLREMQHISQVQLATDVGIRAGPLGWIERGRHLPSGRVLYLLAQRLNVKIDDLFQDKNVWEDAEKAVRELSPVIFPPLESKVGTDKEAVKSAHIICQTVVEAMLKLEDMCGTVQQPTLSLHSAFTPDAAGADHLSASVRRSLGIRTVVMEDYLNLFDAMGLRVIFLDMPEERVSFGGYDPANRNVFIFVNSRLRQQPELQTGHMIEELGRVFWYTRKRYVTEPMENPAYVAESEPLDETEFVHQFTMCFLMPVYALRKTVWQLGITPKTWSLDLVLNMKKRYGVRALRFAQRLKCLGLSWSERQKSDPQYYRFKDELDAFHAEHGSVAEPGGHSHPLRMNGRLGDLLALAEQKICDDPDSVAAIKQVLRKSGVYFP